MVKTVEEREDVAEETVSIGPQLQRQELLLDSWSLKLQYQALCRVLTQGLSTHFTFNTGVRGGLGACLGVFGGVLGVFGCV